MSIDGQDDEHVAATRARLEEAHRRRQDRDRIRKEAQAPEKQLKVLRDKMSKVQKKIVKAEAAVKDKEDNVEWCKQEVIHAQEALDETKANVDKLQQEGTQLQQEHAALVLKLKSQKGEQHSVEAILHWVGLDSADQLPEGAKDIMDQVYTMLHSVTQQVKEKAKDNKDKDQTDKEKQAEGAAPAHQGQTDVDMEEKAAVNQEPETPGRTSPPHKTPKRDFADTPASMRTPCS